MAQFFMAYCFKLLLLGSVTGFMAYAAYKHMFYHECVILYYR